MKDSRQHCRWAASGNIKIRTSRAPRGPGGEFRLDWLVVDCAYLQKKHRIDFNGCSGGRWRIQAVVRKEVSNPDVFQAFILEDSGAGSHTPFPLPGSDAATWASAVVTQARAQEPIRIVLGNRACASYRMFGAGYFGPASERRCTAAASRKVPHRCRNSRPCVCQWAFHERLVQVWWSTGGCLPSRYTVDMAEKMSAGRVRSHQTVE